jgi:hypothetical protein
MLVKESSFTPGRLFPGGDELEMPESVPVREKKLELENLFWWDFHRLGILPRWLSVEGDRVRVSDGKDEVLVTFRVLSAGLSVVLKDEGKRHPPINGRPFGRQIVYIAWHGRRA